MCTFACVSAGAHRGQKGASYALELSYRQWELPDMGVGIQIPVLCKSNKCPSPEPLLWPNLYLYYMKS